VAIQREYSLGALAVAIGRVHDAVARSELPRARHR
jgi:hypothetical protein